MKFATNTLIAFLFTVSFAYGNIINVPSDSTTIHAAVDGASSGDTILVGPGSYFNSSPLQPIVLDKDMTLRSSDGYLLTSISNMDKDDTTVIAVINADVTIEGFTFEYDSDAIYSSRIMKIDSSNVIISNCIIRGGDFYYGDAIRADSSRLTLHKCEFLQTRGDYYTFNGTVTSSNGQYFMADSCLFDSVMAQNGDWNLGAAIQANCDTVIITNSLFKNIATRTMNRYKGGVLSLESDNLFVSNNIFTNNHFKAEIEIPEDYDEMKGVAAYLDGNGEFSNNVIVGNSLHVSSSATGMSKFAPPGGMVYSETDSISINNNIVCSNLFTFYDQPQSGSGFRGSYREFKNNLIWGNTPDNVAGPDPYDTAAVYINSNPRFSDNDFHLAANSPAVGSSTTGGDIGAVQGNYGTPIYSTIYVDDVPTDTTQHGTLEYPYATIQAAIDASVDGDSVIVLPGTYTGEGNRDVFLDGKKIAVAGLGGSDSVTINVLDYAYPAFVCDSSEDSTTSIEGFTIIDADIGVFLESSATLSDLVITGCSSHGIRAGQSTSLISNCDITYNNGSGLYIEMASYITISNCDIGFNEGDGVTVMSGGGEIKYTRFIENYNRGVNAEYVLDKSQLMVDSCYFERNTSFSIFGTFIAKKCVFTNSSYAVGGNVLAHGLDYSIDSSLFDDIRNDVIKSAANTTISNSVIRNCSGQIVEVWWDERCSFSNCEIYNNSGLGIVMPGGGDGSSCHLSDCLYYGNSSPIVLNQWAGSVTNCTIANNDCSPLSMNGPIDINNNIVAFNNGFGLSDEYATVSSSCNDFYSNDSGNYKYDDLHELNGNISLDPRFCDTTSGDFTLAANSPCLPGNNSCAQLMGAYGDGCLSKTKTWYVSLFGNDTTGNGGYSNPFATIQKGIDASVDGDTVMVMPGTYTGEGNRNLDPNGKSIYIYSEFGRDSVTIDCEGEWGFSVKGFFFQNGEDSNTVVDGFNIIKGSGYAITCLGASPKLINCRFANCNVRGAMYCDSAAPYLENCLFTMNTTGCSACKDQSAEGSKEPRFWEPGGAIEMYNHSDLEINNCQFIHNYTDGTEGGAIASFNSSADIINSTFTDNSSGYYLPGGAILITSSNFNIESCHFINNAAGDLSGGGALHINDSSIVSVINCFFGNNYAQGSGGGIVCQNSSLSLVNSVLDSNLAYSEGGGGISTSNSDISIDSCLFYRNASVGSFIFGGGAIMDIGSNMTINNSTIALNIGGRREYEGDPQGSAFSLNNGNTKINSSIISYNKGSDVISIENDSTSLKLDCVNVYGNEYGDLLDCIIDQIGVDGNVSLHPRFCDTANGDFTLAANSPCLPDINLCAHLMGAYGEGCLANFKTWYISNLGSDTTGDGSEGNPYATIQKGINAAIDGDKVMILPGTYTGDGNRDISVGGKKILISGQLNSDSTFINCQLGGDGFVVDHDEDSATIIRSIVIDSALKAFSMPGWAGGFANIENCVIQNSDYGVYWATSGGFGMKISDCSFLNNNVGAYLDIDPWMKVADFDDCIFEYNDLAIHGSFDLVDCEFRYNNHCVYGTRLSGFWIDSSLFEFNNDTLFYGPGLLPGGTIENSIINYNLGEIAYIRGSEATGRFIHFNNCIITNNSGGIKVNGYWEDGLSMSNCLYANNGGPVATSYNQFGYGFNINNCTFVSNSCTPVISNTLAEKTNITNSIIAFNNGFGINAHDSSNISCCNIYANDSGNYDTTYISDQTGLNGNISFDPLFCFPDTGNFNLSNISPCLPNNNGCGVLMGAYGEGCTVAACRAYYVSEYGGDDVNGNGTIDNPFATVQHGIDIASVNDTVIVLPGTYMERISIDKGLVLISDVGPETTILHGVTDYRVITVTNASDTVEINGFDIREGRPTQELFMGLYNPGGGIFVQGTPIKVKNCYIHDNATPDTETATAGGGIHIRECSYVELVNNDIYQNYAYSGGGVMIRDNCGGIISGNIIDLNISETSGPGIWILAPAFSLNLFQVVNNTVVYNMSYAGTMGSGFEARMVTLSLDSNIIAFNDGPSGTSQVWITDCDVTLDCNDIYPGLDSVHIDPPVSHSTNISVDPQFCESVNRDYSLHPDSPCLPENNDCGVLIGAMGEGACGGQTCDTLHLFQGWNLLSSYIEPPDLDPLVMFDPIISSVNIIKDCDGPFCIPDLICNITNWDIHSAYKIHTDDATFIELCGDVIPYDKPIPVTAGWNCIAYYPQCCMDAPTAIASIESLTNIIKDGAGGFFIPGLINAMDDLCPFEGFSIHMAAPATLVYPECPPSAKQSIQANVEQTTPKYFVRDLTTDEYHAIVIQDVDGLTFGDEVGVYCDDMIIGGGVYTGGPIAVSVWHDDPETKEADGYVDGDQFMVKIWHSIDNTESNAEVTLLSGSLRLGESPYTVLSLSPAESLEPYSYELSVNYPNPFNPVTIIDFSLPQSEHVEITIHNILGQTVKKLIDDVYPSGQHSAQWDSRNENGQPVASGIYFYHIKAGDFEQTKKMTLMK